MVDEKKEYYRKVRGYVLETIQVALRMYKKTKDEKWLNDARELGKQSEFFKTLL